MPLRLKMRDLFAGVFFPALLYDSAFSPLGIFSVSARDSAFSPHVIFFGSARDSAFSPNEMLYRLRTCSAFSRHGTFRRLHLRLSVQLAWNQIFYLNRYARLNPCCFFLLSLLHARKSSVRQITLSTLKDEKTCSNACVFLNAALLQQTANRKRTCISTS